MPKIAEIIDTCHNCKHCVNAVKKNENYFFSICTYNEDNAFVLHNGTEPASRFKLTIPENCPLEDYQGNQTIKEDDY